MPNATNPPPEWPRITPALYYDDPAAAIEWLVRAFGFQERLVVRGRDGRIHHAELTLGPGVVMVAHGHADRGQTSPGQLGGANTQGLLVFVADVDAHCAHARVSGARVVAEPATAEFGDRMYQAADLEGHMWWFAQRVDDDAWRRASSVPDVTVG